MRGQEREDIQEDLQAHGRRHRSLERAEVAGSAGQGRRKPKPSPRRRACTTRTGSTNSRARRTRASSSTRKRRRNSKQIKDTPCMSDAGAWRIPEAADARSTTSSRTTRRSSSTATSALEIDRRSGTAAVPRPGVLHHARTTRTRAQGHGRKSSPSSKQQGKPPGEQNLRLIHGACRRLKDDACVDRAVRKARHALSEARVLAEPHQHALQRQEEHRQAAAQHHAPRDACRGRE